MKKQLNKNGFAVVKQLFSPNQLDSAHKVLNHFHRNWIAANHDFYQEKAINSAWLTANKHLDDAKRQVLFELISNEELVAIVEQIIPEPAFLNTQLFFDPVNPKQKSYWHRDIQYGNSEQKQKEMLQQPSLMPHFRLPMVSEKGIELVPRSHKRWDSAIELSVRNETNGQRCFEDLPGSEIVPLERGDLLIFSAKMLHRGIYGKDRFALDILYAEAGSDYLDSQTLDNLPDEKMLVSLGNKVIFERALHEIKCGRNLN